MKPVAMKDFLGMPWLPIDISEKGHMIDELIIDMHYLMITLFIGWLVYYVIAIVMFRAGANPKARYEGTTSMAGMYVVIAVFVMEFVHLIGFSIPIWIDWSTNFPLEKDSVVVRVVGEQYSWSFHYPGPDGKFGRTSPKLMDVQTNPLGIDRKDPNSRDDVVSKKLYLEAKKPVITHITSKDMIHSFGVNVFRVKQDAVPGMSIPISFRPMKTGKYLIACSQLCGVGHTTMKGYIDVLTPEQFKAWMDKQQAKLAPKEEKPAEDAGG